MRVILVFIMLILSGCASIKTYEKIVEGVLESYQSSNIKHHVNYWVPINSLVVNAQDSITLNDEEVESSARDQELCVDNNRGKKFKDEAFSILLFMQCMNEKDWRLHTEEFFIISH